MKANGKPKRMSHKPTLLNDGTVLIAGGAAYWPSTTTCCAWDERTTKSRGIPLTTALISTITAYTTTLHTKVRKR